MIKITVERQGSDFKKINIQGHAEFDVRGSDIVCAGVSALFFAAVNTLGKLFPHGEGFTVETVLSGVAEISFSSRIESQVIALNLFTGLENIKQEFSEFVKIEEVNINGS